jgi:Lrp/AsnC family leucine-responsive transcriptional regulator
VDDIDRQLLRILADQARTSYADLARLVGLSAPSVQERLRRLERDGVWRGSRAQVDPKALGLGVSALVSVQQREGVDADEVSAAIARVVAVEDCWVVAGDEALVLKVRVRDLDALDQTLRDLRQVPGVTRTRTTVVLSTVFEGRVRIPDS